MRLPGSIVSLLGAAMLLSGCVVAAVPLVTGSLIARKAATGKRTPATATLAPADADGAIAAVRPVIVAMPDDPAQMVPGTFNTGNFPTARPATGAMPTPLVVAGSSTAVTGPAPVGVGVGWPELVRFVAITKGAARHSALLVRGGALADPRWVGCAGKKTAVLAPVSLIVKGPAERPIAERDLGWIVALPTIGTALVVVADGPAEAAAARTAFARAGLPRPVVGDTLLIASSEADLPAVRAAVGARYCVVALAGRRAADFPNALLPASTPPALADQWRAGWFLFDAAAG